MVVGTGKSVIAINLLANLTKLGLFGQTGNLAPSSVSITYGGLSGRLKFQTFSGAETESSYDALIVDEAHRLNAKSGCRSLGRKPNQGKYRPRHRSFSWMKHAFTDIGCMEEIRDWAKHFGAEVEASSN